MTKDELRAELEALGVDAYDFDSVLMAVDALAACSGATRDDTRTIVLKTIKQFGLSAK